MGFLKRRLGKRWASTVLCRRDWYGKDLLCRKLKFFKKIRCMTDLFLCCGRDFISLLCVRMYCIFSTLPLDVENTVIRTQSLKVMVFCVLEKKEK